MNPCQAPSPQGPLAHSRDRGKAGTSKHRTRCPVPVPPGARLFARGVEPYPPEWPRQEFNIPTNSIRQAKPALIGRRMPAADVEPQFPINPCSSAISPARMPALPLEQGRSELELAPVLARLTRSQAPFRFFLFVRMQHEGTFAIGQVGRDFRTQIVHRLEMIRGIPVGRRPPIHSPNSPARLCIAPRQNPMCASSSTPSSAAP
jgi:hypothetical protein